MSRQVVIMLIFSTFIIPACAHDRVTNQQLEEKLSSTTPIRSSDAIFGCGRGQENIGTSRTDGPILD